MNDHAQRIKENQRIDERERNATKFVWLACIVIALITAYLAISTPEPERNRASFSKSVFAMNQAYLDANPKVRRAVYGRKG